ncbi:MAG: helix-turn-helix transcriptional regulator [Planctomycetes bacterium]|nr:helix-turn-helix transcriptional regulator [Planctomycetota bacterium]
MSGARPPAADHPAEGIDVDITAAVSANLKRLRAEHALTLDQLSETSGVSRAMLNQIETGKSVPTIATLWKVAAGLHVPFQQLIQVEAAPKSIVMRRADAKVLTNAEGTFSSRALFPYDGGPRTTEFYELVLAPGGIERAEAHARGTREQIVVVQGRITIEVGGIAHNLAERDSIGFEADVPHSYINPDQRREALLYLVMTYADPVR